MLRGYTEAGLHQESLLLFHRMRRSGVRPDRYTLPSVLASCSRLPAPMRVGEEVHCLAIKTGLQSNAFVAPALIGVYSSSGSIDTVHKVLTDMPVRSSVVAATAAVEAFLSVGDLISARQTFDRTAERDVVLWNTILSGYTRCGDMAAARELFAQMPDRDVMSWNTILLGYANGRDLRACEKLFEEMPERNAFSWNGLIGGYARSGRFFDALGAFRRMLSDVVPNDATLVAVLSACSKLGALNWGRLIHAYAESNGFKGNLYVGNGLIDMYSKCGRIDDAVGVFREMHSRDLITWNSIIAGLGVHGRGKEALELYDRMKELGKRPDGITFVGALVACVHMGLVDDGFAYFRSMSEDFAIAPWIEHYGCMVDLLGRAGLLYQALDFVARMPMEPDCVIWTALLGACQVHRHIDLAEHAMNQLVRLEPEEVANYLVLSNIYGAVGRWEDAARLKRLARAMGGLRKLPGCSWVQVDSQLVKFFSSDSRHRRTEEIYGILEELRELSKLVGSEAVLDELCQ